MSSIVGVDAWVSALVFIVLMTAGWLVGIRLRTPEAGASTRVEDGGLALFGLLLAFCFSGAAARYEARKDLLRDDVIAISEFAAVSSILDAPERGELLVEVRRYVEQRIVFGRTRLEASEMPQLIHQGQLSQARMLVIVRRAIGGKNSPSIHTPLLNAFNGLTEAHDKRLFGLRDQVNGNIVLMLVLLGVFTTFTMGRMHNQQGGYGLLRIWSYIGLVALVFYVTVDMEQPRRGLIVVSQTPMQELYDSLQVQVP